MKIKTVKKFTNKQKTETQQAMTTSNNEQDVRIKKNRETSYLARDNMLMQN